MRLRHFFAVSMLGLLPHAQAEMLRDAFERAWTVQPEALAQPAREDELVGRRAAAQAWSPQPPVLSLSHKTDRTDRNQGLREWEVEVGGPLWQPGERRRQAATVDAEHGAYRSAQQQARWRLAGEVREAWWRLQLAASDATVATRRLSDAAALADDLARRLKAGSVARVEFNQAQMAKQAAQLAQTQAEAGKSRAQGDWQALTHTTTATPLDSAPEEPAQPLGAHPTAEFGTETGAPLDRHPALQAAMARVATAHARLALAGVNLRESPELSLALTRERQSSLEPYGQLLTLKLKLPFGGDNRNHPRQAAANAELIEAQASLDLLRRQLAAEIVSADADLRQQQEAVVIASERQRLAQDNFALLEKAYRLGHVDLSARLRADSERFDAEQGLARARLEAARAVSRYNQALGVLP